MNLSPNPQAPVQCQREIVVAATPAQVWAVLADINAWAAWQPAITKPRLNGPLQPGTTFDWKTGGAGIHSTLHTVQPAQALGWTGTTFGLFAIHNWSLRPVPGGTAVAVAESMEGWLARLFKGAFNRNLARDMQLWLERLKATVEKP